MSFKILLVSSNLSMGGAQRFLVNFAKFLAKKHYVFLVGINENNDNTLLRELPTTIKYKCLKKRAAKSIFSLALIINKENPDIVISTQVYINLVVILSKVLSFKKPKLVIRDSSTLPSKKSPLFWLSFLLYRFADTILVLSQEIKGQMATKYWLNSNKIFLTPNYINHLELEEKAQLFDVKKSNKKNTVFTFCGRVEKVKRVDLLINALSKVFVKHKLFEFWIIGSGTDLNRIKEICHKQNLSFVRFLGFQENPFPFLKKTDVLLLASEKEGFPNIVIEAMALQSIVLTNNFEGGAAKEILQGDLENFIYDDFDSLSSIAFRLATESNKDSIKEKFYSRSLLYSQSKQIIELEKIIFSNIKR